MPSTLTGDQCLSLRNDVGSLLKVDNAINAEIISTRKPTYWSTDPNKIPDLLDYFIIKGISSYYI